MTTQATDQDLQLAKPAAPVKILTPASSAVGVEEASPCIHSLSRRNSLTRLSAAAEPRANKDAPPPPAEPRGDVDFVGPAKAVRRLFSLPYSTDRNVSVALHNVGNGTILLDAGEDIVQGGDGEGAAPAPGISANRNEKGRRGRRRQRPESWSVRSETIEDEESNDEEQLNGLQLAQQQREGERSLLASLSMLLEEEKRQLRLGEADGTVAEEARDIVRVLSNDDADEDEGDTIASKPSGNETALALPSNAIMAKQDDAIAEREGNEADAFLTGPNASSGNGDPNDPLANKLHPPQHYLSHAVVPPSEPRQYVDWQFHDMKLLVASDALIYNQNGETNQTQSNANEAKNESISVKVADAGVLKSQMRHHEKLVREGAFFEGGGDGRHRRALPPSSYAEALRTPSSNISASNDESDAHADDGVTLQTCIIPASGVGPELAKLGFEPSPSPPALVDDEPDHATAVNGGISGVETADGPASQALPQSSPVCTVLDTYLDNIMANVPQLALILREHGFVQNIKLLRTEDIPAMMMHPSTLGDNGEFPSSSACPPIFSPDIVEMNAAMLLRFLKTNCTRENSTYLLHRAAGDTNIQLFDISSISELRQRKWVWWLALCSYRFACRLEQLQTHAVDPWDRATRREYRSRQRSLLHNTLNLLEELADMNGGRHETIGAAVCEHLADTYLWNDEADGDVSARDASKPAPCASSSQPYQNVTVDCLDKAHDHLMNGIKMLTPLLTKAKEDEAPIEIEAISIQLYGIHHKLVNVNLRLADHHLQNYFSSNLIQSLRTAARTLNDAACLLEPLNMFGLDPPEETADASLYTQSILLQYAWLFEYCGHFARSFAGDELWRERGHTCGSDLIGLFREVHLSCDNITTRCFRKQRPSKTSAVASSSDVGVASHGQVSLDSLSGVVILPSDFEQIEASVLQKEGCREAIGAAKSILDQKTQIKRDARQVLVAACLCYGHAIDAFVYLTDRRSTGMDEVNAKNAAPQTSGLSKQTEKDSTAGSLISVTSKSDDVSATVAPLLRQRLGDACNEIGKILLEESRTVLSPRFNPDKGITKGCEQKPYGLSHVSAIMLASASFWFSQGLEQFEHGNDLRNLALLRCNLCQCCKIRANSNVILPAEESVERKKSSSEIYLQEAVDHLVSAHEAMGQRESDPLTWDMVSEELAATLLVLGVRRRQSALSSSSEPLLFQAMRLTPGIEKSIVDPMERSCRIYQSLGTPRSSRQAAAAHYQLALYFSKVWTCQRDEAKTREKLAAAFKHYGSAHQYFYRNIRGNETTFVVLSLDFSGFYAAVSGEEALHKALLCCLDTREAFAHPVDSPTAMQQLATLAENIEARVSKLVLGLVKIEKEGNSKKAGNTPSERYKNMYREVLGHKMKPPGSPSGPGSAFPIYDLLNTLSEKLN